MIGLTPALLVLSVAEPSLEWRAPEGCPTRDDVLASLSALSAPAEIERVRARGVIRKVGHRYELRLDVRTRRLTDRRTERADSCQTLGDLTALLIAIAVDPVDVAAQLSTLPAPPPEPLPLSVPVPEPAPAPVAPPPAEAPRLRPKLTSERPPSDPVHHPTSFLLRVDGALDAGATQGPGGDVGGAFGLLHRRLRVELHGLYTPPHPLTSDNERVGRLARWALGARACGRFVRRGLEVPLCLGLEAGRFLATGAGVSVDRSTWFAALLGVGVLWFPHPRVGLGARAEFVASPFLARFFVHDQYFFVTQPIGLRFGVGVEIRLGSEGRRDGSAPRRPRSR